MIFRIFQLVQERDRVIKKNEVQKDEDRKRTKKKIIEREKNRFVFKIIDVVSRSSKCFLLT